MLNLKDLTANLEEAQTNSVKQIVLEESKLKVLAGIQFELSLIRKCLERLK